MRTQGRILWVVILLSCFILNTIPVLNADTKTGDPPAYDYWHAPDNSFGSSGSKIVNWTTFKHVFQNHTIWSLEYKRYSYSSWTNGSQYLTIKKQWNENGYWKFSLVLDVPVNVFSVRFTFGINLNCLQYINRTGYEVYVNYTANLTETYSCVFNWSDIAHIPGLVITHGIQNNMFWFRFLKNTVPAGHYTFDPQFGYTSSFASTASIANMIRGIKSISPPTGGYATSITALLRISLAAANVKCAIYDYVTGVRLGITQVKSVTSSVNTWWTFNFATPVKLWDTRSYMICAMASTTCLIARDTIVMAGISFNKTRTYTDNFPDPIGSIYNYDYQCSIYCNFTSENISFSSLSPSQNQVGVPFDVTDGINHTGSLASTEFPVMLRCWWSSNWSTSHINGSRGVLYNFGPAGSNWVRMAFNGTAKLWHNTTNPKLYYFNLTGKTTKNHSIRGVRFRSNTAEDPTDLRLYRSVDGSTWLNVFTGVTTCQDTDAWVYMNFTPCFTAKYLRIDVYDTEAADKHLQWGVSPFGKIFEIYAGDEFKSLGNLLMESNGSFSYQNKNVSVENKTYCYYLDTSNFTNASYLWSAYAPFINFTTGFLAGYIPPSVGGIRLFSIPMIVIYGFAGGWFFMFFWRRRKKKKNTL